MESQIHQKFRESGGTPDRHPEKRAEVLFSKAEPKECELQRYRKAVLRCCLNSETFTEVYRDDAIYSNKGSL